MNIHTLSQDEKIELFMGLFAGLKNVYGSYDIKTGKAYQIKSMVDRNTIVGHLWGLQPYGVYLLVGDKARAIAVDFDTNELTPVVRFMAETGRFGIPVYIERSKSKGYHVWMFFEHPVPASKARIIVYHILNKIGYGVLPQVFPKRDRLDEKISYGNFINAPLFCLSLKQQKTVFVDPSNCYRPFKDQWQLLYNINKTSEEKLDELIEKLGLTTSANICSPRTKNTNNYSNCSHPPCIQKMLDQGVTENQRLACFHIGVSHWRINVPFDETINVLNAWARGTGLKTAKGLLQKKKSLLKPEVLIQADIAALAVNVPL